MTKASQVASILWEKPQTSPLQLTLDSKAAVLLEQVSDGRPCCKQNRAHTEVPTQRLPISPQQHTFPQAVQESPVPLLSLYCSLVFCYQSRNIIRRKGGDRPPGRLGGCSNQQATALAPVSRLSPALAVLV